MAGKPEKTSGRSVAEMAELQKIARAVMDNPQSYRPALTLEKLDVLRVLECTECRVTFALPETMYVARTEASQSIGCPAGHAVIYPPIDEKSAIGLMSRKALLAELTNLRVRVERAETRNEALAPVPGSAEFDEAELRRRAKALAATAKGGNGGLICPVCGNSARHRNSLYRHLRRFHEPSLRNPIPAGN